MTTGREIVDVLTSGGRVRVDVTSSVENGLLDEADCETTTHVLAAVKAAIRAGNSLDGVDGRRVLIESFAPIAYTYAVE